MHYVYNIYVALADQWLPCKVRVTSVVKQSVGLVVF